MPTRSPPPSLVIEPAAATHFIAGYQRLLAAAAGESDQVPRARLIELLHEGRGKVAADPALIDTAAASLEAQGAPVPADVLQAVRTLRLKRWLYLRDTTRHSIFIDPAGDAAYAVLGLTNRLRDVIGGTGVVATTAVVEYRGRYLCDGVFATPLVWIGSNMRRRFGELLARLKADGRFHMTCADGPAPQPPTAQPSRARRPAEKPPGRLS